MGTRKNTEIVLEEFKAKHGDRYDYRESVYLNARTKIGIGCRKHGIFYMLPTNHLRGQNCPACRKSDHEEVICKLIKIHKNKYDYSLLDFKNLTDKVKIICPTHGVFEQNLQDHLKGHKCPKCRGLYRTKWEVIKLFENIHNRRYSYEKMGDSFKSRDKIKIKCAEHGFFFQTVNNHLRGQGCRKCSDLLPRTKKNKSTYSPKPIFFELSISKTA